ncbi:hypothetical protein AYI70_g2647 [Smittium culicis]|uniref:Uncharacterized protein n=1 Tax=Smittium culicis TaxID=133412 RepID=A0A1R1Y7K8_9FUNG|nr:hypothetical protein AYI70_g2647 [Smittium culicis]
MYYGAQPNHNNSSAISLNNANNINLSDNLNDPSSIPHYPPANSRLNFSQKQQINPPTSNLPPLSFYHF